MLETPGTLLFAVSTNDIIFSIADDALPNADREFRVRLSRNMEVPENVFEVMPAEATVIIADDDGGVVDLGMLSL